MEKSTQWHACGTNSNNTSNGALDWFQLEMKSLFRGSIDSVHLLDNGCRYVTQQSLSSFLAIMMLPI